MQFTLNVPRTLTDEMVEDIHNVVLNTTPNQLGYEQCKWNCVLLTRYLQDKYGKKYSDTWIRKLLKALGFTYKRGIYKPTLANQQLQEDFKKMSVLLDIIEPVEDIFLWAMDETGKKLESNNYYSWRLKGKPTAIESNGSHKGLKYVPLKY